MGGRGAVVRLIEGKATVCLQASGVSSTTKWLSSVLLWKKSILIFTKPPKRAPVQRHCATTRHWQGIQSCHSSVWSTQSLIQPVLCLQHVSLVCSPLHSSQLCAPAPRPVCAWSPPLGPRSCQAHTLLWRENMRTKG